MDVIINIHNNWPDFALDKGGFKQIICIVVNMFSSFGYPSNLEVIGYAVSW